MQITVPKTIKDCTPEQLAKWVFLSGGQNDLETLTGKLDFRVQVVSIFSGVSRSRLELSDYRDINRAFEHIIGMLADHKEAEPSEVITIDGKRYVFDKDFRHKTTGQIIDLKLIDDVYSDPCQVLAIIYIEEGLKYNELNDREQVINPIQNRIKVFKEWFPGDEFLNVFGFFLRHYTKQKNAIFALTMAKMKIMKEQITTEVKEQIQDIKTGSRGQE